VVLGSKNSETTYLLKELSFVNKRDYETEYKRLQGLESQPHNENILALVRFFSQTYNNICSTSYRIYALYDYPSITLHDEITTRHLQAKYFEECELWSILQSCANALADLTPAISLHPKNIFIVPDGVLKTIHNDMVSEDYRCVVKDYLYYAPEKINDFKRTDSTDLLRK
jgi:hypothetical protein